MFNSALVDAFTSDPTVRVIAALWALDFLMGLYAGIKKGEFRLSYIADTFRNDVIGKILPYYTLWAALHLTGIDFSIAGLDVVEETAGAVIIAAFVGSILKSVSDLGIAKSLPDTLAGPDPATPPVVPTPPGP